ncbi:MAG: tetraacyldisaccharide 4'-kinase [Bacteroidales bacterium]|nr:tetraacyldisaccharide 4'-kinase [Bacteroidales bacterium]
MIDKLVLFPYYLALKIRHTLYNKGIKKSRRGAIPTICVGNITVGGTGKTPHTEMILRALLRSDDWGMREISVLSRGYKRRSKGFQRITKEDGAGFAGDEPAQITKNFPGITVAVCKDRLEGLDFLAHPEKLTDTKKGRKCLHKDFAPAQIAVLDDAFQYRALRPDFSIVLVDYNRPIYKDSLMPIGRLRDLPERIKGTDTMIVTKCPVYMEVWEKTQWLSPLGIEDYDTDTCTGTLPGGKKLSIFFTSINYQPLEPVFQTLDRRYSYSSRAILFTGIAKDTPLRRYLSDSFKIVRHFKFADHHKFTSGDIRSLLSAAEANPTAAVITTEKDAQRILDCKNVPEFLRQRMLYVPIKVAFLSETEEAVFEKTMLEALRPFIPEP